MKLTALVALPVIASAVLAAPATITFFGVKSPADHTATGLPTAPTDFSVDRGDLSSTEKTIGGVEGGTYRFENEVVQTKYVVHKGSSAFTLLNTPVTYTEILNLSPSGHSVDAPYILFTGTTVGGAPLTAHIYEECQYDVAGNKGSCVVRDVGPLPLRDSAGSITSVTTNTLSDSYSGSLVPLTTLVLDDVSTAATTTAASTTQQQPPQQSKSAGRSARLVNGGATMGGLLVVLSSLFGFGFVLV